MGRANVDDPTTQTDAGKHVTDEAIDQYLADLDAFAAEIGKSWPEGVSAVDAVNDVRRDLGSTTIGERAMTQVGIKELKTQASAIVRRVEEDGRTIDITRRGEVVARLIPVRRTIDRPTIEQVLAERERLATELSGGWREGISAADAVAEDRRDL